MKNMLKLLNSFFLVFLFVFFAKMQAQNDTIAKNKNLFFKDVRFGGGLGLAVGNGYSDLYFSPTAFKPLNHLTTIGFGIIGSYVKNRDFFTSTMYGVSVIGLVNPIQEMQLSAEVEQLRVNLKYNTDSGFKTTDNFWNTALFLGIGYRSDGVTIGMRYNVLYREKNNVYSQAWMPFVRIIF
jgi:hypothetical protein